MDVAVIKLNGSVWISCAVVGILYLQILWLTDVDDLNVITIYSNYIYSNVKLLLNHTHRQVKVCVDIVSKPLRKRYRHIYSYI